MRPHAAGASKIYHDFDFDLLLRAEDGPQRFHTAWPLQTLLGPATSRLTVFFGELRVWLYQAWPSAPRERRGPSFPRLSPPTGCIRNGDRVSDPRVKLSDIKCVIGSRIDG